MKCQLKSLILAVALGAATAAHATGIPADDGAVDYYLKQAQTMADQVQAQARGLTVAQTQTLPANRGALPSNYADAGRANAAVSVDTNQQILGTLIGIDSTLKQLLELERLKASAAVH
ncbi:hypothetical protein [Burkholderia ubonensis]|uniref:hypothetical protein n=1 Tax=Burkholderia ubonensis TaxID=101571 RepID=UPI000A57DE98|nr:hypothetical protein [Burkholderia ubonensis]